MCVNNLSKVALDSAAAGTEPAISSRKSYALTALGFLVSSGFLGVFSDIYGEIWFFVALQVFSAFYYHFTDDTNLHGNETPVAMIFILLLFHT